MPPRRVGLRRFVRMHGRYPNWWSIEEEVDSSATEEDR